MSNSKTSGFYNEGHQRVFQSVIDKSSGSASGVEPYGVVLPSNINVFSSITEQLSILENRTVVAQVQKVLTCLYISIKKAHKQRTLTNYLSRVNLVQQEDTAALLEWNFQDFRVGFALEPQDTDSSYFIVSQDKSTGSFETDTQKLDADISRSVEKIVQYVLENT